MSWDKMILNLIECANTIYKIESEQPFEDLSSDGLTILSKIDLLDIANQLELVAKVMFVDHYSIKDVKAFLENKIQGEKDCEN